LIIIWLAQKKASIYRTKKEGVIMKKLITLVLAISMSLCMFCGIGFAAETVNIVAMKGPTGMGMVSMMNEAESGTLTGRGYNFTIVNSADEVTPLLVRGNADIAAVPANLASVLFNNNNGEIQVLAINTLGVLYIVETGNTIQSVEDLRGKTIYSSGKGTTPEYALKYVLKQNGLNPDKDVRIEWKSEQAECLSALAVSDNAIAMLPQPFVTTAQTKNPDIRVALDLTAEWNAVQTNEVNPSAMVTGVVVARKEFIEKNPDIISVFMNDYKASVEFVNSNTPEAAKLVGKYGIVAEAVALKALPACNITFIEGDEMKVKLSGYLNVLFEQNAKSVGGKVPADTFYFKR